MKILHSRLGSTRQLVDSNAAVVNCYSYNACGDFKEPMTLHAYLYCLNDPINRTDPAGTIPIPRIFREVIGLLNYRNIMISAAVRSARSAWGMAERLTSIQNMVATIVEERDLANRAFIAIGCLGEARASAAQLMGHCLKVGFAGPPAGAVACISLCSISGPMMPACLSTCLKVAGIGLAAADMACIMEIEATYNRDILRCMD